MTEGSTVGNSEGNTLGPPLAISVGAALAPGMVGNELGKILGIVVGNADGSNVGVEVDGLSESTEVGVELGTSVGLLLLTTVGALLDSVGTIDGLCEGEKVGVGVGWAVVGLSDGWSLGDGEGGSLGVVDGDVEGEELGDELGELEICVGESVGGPLVYHGSTRMWYTVSNWVLVTASSFSDNLLFWFPFFPPVLPLPLSPPSILSLNKASSLFPLGHFGEHRTVTRNSAKISFKIGLKLNNSTPPLGTCRPNFSLHFFVAEL